MIWHHKVNLCLTFFYMIPIHRLAEKLIPRSLAPHGQAKGLGCSLEIAHLLPLFLGFGRFVLEEEKLLIRVPSSSGQRQRVPTNILSASSGVYHSVTSSYFPSSCLPWFSVHESPPSVSQPFGVHGAVRSGGKGRVA